MKKIIALIFVSALILCSCSNTKTSSNSTSSTTVSLTSTLTDIPTVSKPVENPAMDAYKAVLNNKADFFSTDDKKNVYLNNFLNVRPEDPMKVTHFTVLDIDGDKTPEVVLELSIGDFEVLHYMNSKVYGYDIVNRGLMQLKTDGTSWGSNGAADNSCEKVKFSSDGFKYDVLAYSESSITDDTFSVSYFIKNKTVTEEEFNSFSDKQDGKEDAVWYEFSPKNIEAELFIHS